MLDFLSVIEQRIDEILKTHSSGSKSIASFGFIRLARYFTVDILRRTSAVAVPRCPLPQLDDLGVAALLEMESINPIGITYKNTYFIRNGYENDESLHFHELIHVVQWSHLGPSDCLNQYFIGLQRFGYRNNPLEEMAYQHQSNFNHGSKPYNVVTAVKKELDALQK